MKKLGFLIIFAVGAVLAGTANLQLTIGAILMAVGYTEFRRSGLTLSQIDEIIATIHESIKGTNDEQK